MSISPPASAAELKTRALRYLARREHSRAELARKLAPYAESEAALRALLDELVLRKQLSDERYAEVRAHWLGRKYGAARIRQDLKAHGVSAHVSDAADFEKAKAILARKYRGAPGTLEEKARRARFLQSRGFSHDVISRLILSARSAD